MTDKIKIKIVVCKNCGKTVETTPELIACPCCGKPASHVACPYCGKWVKLE